MEKILFKKILFDCLSFFLISLISASAVVWVFQAVNFLDIMVEDGRSYLVYANYSLLNFPKIISKILPFALFFGIFFVLTKYELNNELIIFWSFGVNKMKLINFFIKTSFILVFFQILFTSFLVPKALEFSRSLIKNSNVDFFEGFVKPKKFNDTIKNLTIYADSKDDEGNLINLYLKKDMRNNSYQVTYSKIGKFLGDDNRKILKLYDGQTINYVNDKISKFNFQSSDFSLANLDASIIPVNKTQETSTVILISCLNDLLKLKISFLEGIDFKNSVHNCRKDNLDNIYKELYKRFIIPFYIPILILISLLLIIKSKESIDYLKYRIIIFLFGLSAIIFSEVTLKFIENSFLKNTLITFLPFLIFLLFYLFFFQNLKFNNQQIIKS
jgi:lipopolysaccharide export system permease protein